MEPLSCRDCVENNASVLPNNGITDEPQVGGEALQGNYWIAFCHENFVPRFFPRQSGAAYCLSGPFYCGTTIYIMPVP